MRLHSATDIREYTRDGYWGTRTLLDELDTMVQAHPNAIALEDPPDRDSLVATAPRTLTWTQFGAAVNGIAAGLQARGIGKDDIVIVQLPNVWELPALYFALGSIGAVIAPMPVQWRERELRHIATVTGASAFIGVEQLKDIELLARADAVLPAAVERLALGELAAMAARGSVAVERAGLDANDVFTLCWTSGTEAEPKGCPLTHNNWLFQGQSFRQVTDLQDGCRILGPAPIVNMTGVGIMVMWLLSGGTLLLHQPLNLSVLIDQISTAEFTCLVPAILNMLLKLPEDQQPDFSHVRSIATGSAPPPAWAIEEFRRRWGVEVINVYGQNEGTILAAGPADVPDPTRRSRHFPWWGKAGTTWSSGISGISVKIVDDNGNSLTTTGEVGELAYRGPNVFPGYFEAAELNAAVFTADGYLRTGDLFTILDEHHIGFVDRKKDIIIRGGFNISAAEVETVAQGHPGIRDAAAVGMPDEVLGERVCLFVVPQNARSLTLEDVVAFMRNEGLATYKLPERLELIDEIPRNPVGKIVKQELRSRLNVPASA